MQELHSFQRNILEAAAKANGSTARTTAQFSYQGSLANEALLTQVQQALSGLLSSELAQNLLALRSETLAEANLATLDAHINATAANNDVFIASLDLADNAKQLIVSLPGWFADAQSTRVLSKALNQYLENGELPELMAYEKYTQWQQNSLDPEECIFWDSYLQQKLSESPLRFVAPQNAQANIAHTELSVDLANVNGDIRNESALKALWVAVMQRMSLSSSAAFGIVADGRVLPQFHDSLGLYALTVPVNISCEHNTQLHTLAQQLDTFFEENIDAQISVPPNERWTAGPAHTLQFIDTQNTSQPLQLQDIYHHCGEFHTQLLCVQNGLQLTLRLYFNTAHYSQTAMQQMLNSFAYMLEHAELSSPVLQLALTDSTNAMIGTHQAEAAQNNTAINNKTVIAAIQQWAQQSSDTVAAKDATSECTYAALNRASTAVAVGLQSALGSAPKRVALLMENSVQLVKAVCGVLRAGHAIVPVDASQMTQREQAILSECDSVVVDALGEKLLADNQAQSHLAIDALLATETTDSQIEQLAATEIAPTSLASVVYTSGTTGRPKGTLVTHANLMSYLRSAKTAYWNNVSKALVHTPISFDMAHTSFFLPLISGGCVEMLSVDNSLETLTNALDRQTTPVLLKLTPSHIRAMKGWFEQIHTTFNNIAIIVVGGEQLYSNDLRLIQQKMVNTRIINEYGPTETTVGVSQYEVSVEDVGAIPIGYPFPHAQLFVLDEHGNSVAPGMVGELYIGGASVAQGYLQQDALTAERFIDAPAALQANSKAALGKLYKTGDLVVQGSEQEGLRFLRRNDSQLKVRGYRIEKDEIINGLTSLTEVQAAQLLVSQQEQGIQLFAFVSGPSVDAADSLKTQLQTKLPSYMQPHRLHVVNSFPLTANGKIDEAALMAISEQQSQTRSNAYVAPASNTEKQLVEIWQSALEVSDLGITDNFFDIGGDSIRAIYIASTAKENGFSLKVQDIMQNPTIAELAPIVDAASKTLDNLEALSEAELEAAIDDMDLSDVDSLLNELDNA